MQKKTQVSCRAVSNRGLNGGDGSERSTLQPALLLYPDFWSRFRQAISGETTVARRIGAYLLVEPLQKTYPRVRIGWNGVQLPGLSRAWNRTCLIARIGFPPAPMTLPENCLADNLGEWHESC
jgi:hypothetical protein